MAHVTMSVIGLNVGYISTKHVYNGYLGPKCDNVA